MKIKSIASSSKGCCYIIDNGTHQILIECGVPLSRIRAGNDFDFSRIVACFTSHQHSDHSGFLPKLENETAIPIYCTEGTKKEFNLSIVEIIRPNKIIKPGGFIVFPVELKHDTECFGFIICCGKDVLYYATDTGKVSMHVIPGLTHLMIEANHSVELLADSDAEYKHRVSGYHLDIDSVVEFCKLHKKTLQEVHLIHLSAAHSDADLFQKMVAREIGVPVYVAGE